MSKDDNNANVKLTIYRQYIHHIPTKIIINPRFKEIDIILSFASELGHEKGTGILKPTWKVDRPSIEWMKNLKRGNPHVRVVISIGGVGREFSFAPNEKDKWVINVVKSIKEIVHLYEDIHRTGNIIDGIDIHFDVIETSQTIFSYCIGKVIRELKNDIHLTIDLVSTAPTKLVEFYYHKLYLANEDVINLVDYQFYNQKFSSVKEVVELYVKFVIDYTSTKVLPGISNRDLDPILYEGIIYLIKHKFIPGIFVSNVKSSIDGPDSFSLDKILENLD